ncbi:ATP-binding protein [Shimia sp.]
MAQTRITRKYLRLRSGIALGIVMVASVIAMMVAMMGRDNIAARAQNAASVDMVLLSLSELSLAFYDLKDSDSAESGFTSRGQVRRAAHAAEAALAVISKDATMDTFSPDAQDILTRETLNPLLELQEILFMADVVVTPGNTNMNISRAATLAADLSLRVMPIFHRVRQLEMQAGDRAADRQFLYGILALTITLLGAGVAARFVLLPMERFVIRAQARVDQSRRTAEAASQAKSMFLATMSHEIRTPLNGVLGLAEVLGDTKLDQEQNRMVKMISSSGHALLQLINDVLDLAKIDAGKLTLDHADFDLHELCCETAELFSGQAAKKDVHLEVLPPEGAPTWFVHGAPNAVRQILTNLVGNAVKFTDAGSVTIRLENMPSAPNMSRLVRLTVKDQGIGIAPEALDRIFDQFEQADASTTTKFGGTGLGLAIVKRLAEAMDGHVQVRSVENEGAEFSVVFPVTLAKSTSVETGVRLKHSFGRRILVADDNRVNQLVAQKLLENLGCEVITAANGVEAVDLAQSGEPDLILMDVRMPVMDGLQATREIRANADDPKIRKVPIVGLSANAHSEHRQNGIAAGMNGYLLKPVNREALVAELEQHWPSSETNQKTVEACA